MTQPELKTAREVSEYLLKVTGDALHRQDFDSFAAAFRLPQQITTDGSEFVLKTREDLKTCFAQTCAHFKSLGVTELRRVCEAAEFHGPDRVEATHISHVIAHGEPVVPPYPVFSVLERTDGQWQITASDYALKDDLPQAQALHPNSVADPHASEIYQDHLDCTTDALLRGDFAAFQKSVQLPHQMQTETETRTTSTIEEMRTLFAKFSARYAEIGVTDFVRIAQEAHFVSDTEIRGVHESHLIRHGTRLVPPYPNRVRIVLCDDGTWRETHCANAIVNTADAIHLWAQVAQTPDLPDLNIAPERTSK